MIGARRVRKREGRSNSHDKGGGSSEGIAVGPGFTTLRIAQKGPEQTGRLFPGLQLTRRLISDFLARRVCIVPGSDGVPQLRRIHKLRRLRLCGGG
jgi:hypothetical protein